MKLGRRGLAIVTSIAMHAVLGAAFLLIRPKLLPPEPVIAVRIVPPRAPSTTQPEKQSGGTQPGEEKSRGGVNEPQPGAKKRGTKSVLPEGTVSSGEGSSKGSGETSTATIAGAEGSVRSTDSIDLTLKPTPPLPSLRGSGGLGIRKEGPDLKPGGGGTYSHDDSTWEAKIDHDGSVEFDDKVIPVPRISMGEEGRPTLEIPLDVNDVFLRAMGEDPYAYEKRKFLAETKELRGHMAEVACKENLDRSLLDIRPRMLAIWENSRMSLFEKKRRLFSLWDECAEEGSADILKTSELIRASILGFIEEHLPPDTELAYSDADLTRFNRERHSHAEFTPYGARPNR